MTQTIDNTREIIKTRTYKAPKELLLRMWSNPEHVSNWWGPVGFSTATHEMDFQTGGIWRFTMHGPDGTDYPNLVRYTLVSPDRIEYSHGGDGEPVDFKVVVTFIERDDETEMNFRMSFPTAEEKQRVFDEYGAGEGLTSTMERLGDYASEQHPKELELVIVRRFDAPLEMLWKALTEDDQKLKWMSPFALKMHEMKSDFQPGGAWSFKMVTAEGYEIAAEGEYLEINPMNSFSLSHRWKADDGSFKPTTLIKMSLAEFGGKTTLTFVQSGFWSEESRAAHLGGWSACLHKLDVLVGSNKGHQEITLSREFKAPLELVWDCFTKAERFSQWFAPKPYTSPRCEIDLRPGGELVLVMQSPEGMEHPMHAVITDVSPLESYGWVNRVPGFDGETALLGGTMVYFENLGEKTRVTVNSYASAQSEMGGMMVGGMEMGWNMTLDQLVEVATAN